MSVDHHPEIVAHRGASYAVAEHTRAAYERALNEGADGLECDVRLTADRQLVCVHDRTLARTAGVSGRRSVVSGHSLEQLRALDSTVLTLPELLGLSRDAGRPITLFVETKHPVRYRGQVEIATLAELARWGLTGQPSAEGHRAVLMSFSALAMRRVRRAAPRVPTVLLGESAAVVEGRVADAAGASIIGPSVTSLRKRPGLVSEAAAKGRETYCWTVDSVADAQFCASLGVRWIATNRPGPLRAELLASLPPEPENLR